MWLRGSTHRNLTYMSTIFLTTFLNGYLWMNLIVISLQFHWGNLFLWIQLTMRRYWFIPWLGVDRQQAITWTNIDQDSGVIWLHVDVITWKHFPRYWPFMREFTGHRWIPAQRPVTRGFDVFFDLRLNKRLNKQSWDWWFETQLRPLWRHCTDNAPNVHIKPQGK